MSTHRLTILSVCIGGFLEFYEFNLFIYLAPILAKHYSPSGQDSLLNILVIFAIGYLSRPLGGLLFGYVGDHFGRKIALISSIITITLSTIGFGVLPSHLDLKVAGPILLLLRLAQGIVTGGELSGIMCYLTEDVSPKQRPFVSSWSFFGPQLGAIVSVVECLLLEKHLTYEQFVDWGWRISFLIGGAIGLIGCFLRYRLKETPLFEKIEAHKKVIRIPLLLVLTKYKQHLLLAILLCALPICSNYLVFSFSSIYFQKILNLNFATSITLTALINTLCLITLPLFGKYASKLPLRPLLITCTLLFLLLAYPFYAFLDQPLLAIPLTCLITLLISLFFALIPLVLAELFPTPIRYTSIGLGYTAASSLLGGTAPILAITLIHFTHNTAAPAFILMFAALLTLLALFNLKETKILT